MIKRIKVRYTLQVEPDVDRSVIDRVMEFHANHCPVARSIGGCIEMITEVEIIPMGKA